MDNHFKVCFSKPLFVPYVFFAIQLTLLLFPAVSVPNPCSCACHTGAAPVPSGDDNKEGIKLSNVQGAHLTATSSSTQGTTSVSTPTAFVLCLSV